VGVAAKNFDSRFLDPPLHPEVDAEPIVPPTQSEVDSEPIVSPTQSLPIPRWTLNPLYHLPSHCPWTPIKGVVSPNVSLQMATVLYKAVGLVPMFPKPRVMCYPVYFDVAMVVGGDIYL